MTSRISEEEEDDDDADDRRHCPDLPAENETREPAGPSEAFFLIWKGGSARALDVVCGGRHVPFFGLSRSGFEVLGLKGGSAI
jgi:hypothetical protein